MTDINKDKAGAKQLITKPPYGPVAADVPKKDHDFFRRMMKEIDDKIKKAKKSQEVEVSSFKERTPQPNTSPEISCQPLKVPPAVPPKEKKMPKLTRADELLEVDASTMQSSEDPPILKPFYLD